MYIQHHPHRNLIMEILLAADFIINNNSIINEQTFNSQQLDYIQDVLESHKRLVNVTKKFKNTYHACMLSAKNNLFVITCYNYLLSKNYEPQTYTELFDLFLAMKQDEIIFVMKQCLSMDDDFDNFVATISNIDDMDERQRWYWISAISDPAGYMQQLVSFLSNIAPLYLQERAHYQHEYDQALPSIQKYSLEYLFTHVVKIDDQTKQMILEKNEALHLYIVSPPMLLFMLYLAQNQPNMLFISTRIEKLMQLADDDINHSFHDTLKLLCDPTSYQILKLLTSTNLKSKEIAQQLKITGAAVSYHTQKLVLHKLLIFSTQNNETKYLLNKALIKKTLSSLSDDLKI